MPTINRKVFQDSSAIASVIREVTAMVVEDRDYSTSINLRFPMDQWDAIRTSLSNANIEHHEFASGSTAIKAPIYSRSPIRNALNALCRDGLINLSFVREISVNFPDRHYGIFSLDDIEGEAELEWMWSTIEADDELEETARQMASLDDVRRNVPIYHNDIYMLETAEADTDRFVERVIALTIPFRDGLIQSTQLQRPPRVTIDSDGSAIPIPPMNTTRELLRSLAPLFSSQSMFLSSYPQRSPHVTIESNAKKLENIPYFQPDTIPQDYICPLSLSVMTDPVYLPDDATEQRFERSLISTWLTQKGTHPTTRIKYKSTALISDIGLKNQIDSFVETALTNNTQLNENQSFIYGKGYFLTGLYNEAITTLETAVIENPSCIPHAYYYLGKSNACLKNHELAKHYFLWLIQREDDPKLLSDYYDNMGLLCFQQGFYEEAITDYGLAIHNNDVNLSAIHNLALLYLTLATNAKNNGADFESDYLNSQNLLHKIFENAPNDPHALHAQASLYELTEHYEQAITYYLQARMHCSTEDHSTLSAITTNLAECYAQSGHGFYQTQNYHAAEVFYKKSLEEDPQHHISRNQLGMCLYKLRDFDGARKHFNALINFPLSDSPSQNDVEQNQEIRADAWINRAASLRKTGAFRLSKGSLNMAEDLSSNDATLPEENRELAATIIQQTYRFFRQTTQAALQIQESDMLKP